MISMKFAPIVCALLGLALVPTFIHSYADFTVEDGRTTTAVPTSLGEYTSTPSSRNATWGQRRFESSDWIEREYTAGADRARLTIVRSYDLKALYHHPELAVTSGLSLGRERLEYFDARPEIPVHVLSGTREDGALALYVLHYDDRFVADPIRFQLRTAGELLFSGRRAMTLFFVTKTQGASPVEAGRSPALRLLFAAIDSFMTAPARL
jgi:hypothetical protein